MKAFDTFRTLVAFLAIVLITTLFGNFVAKAHPQAYSGHVEREASTRVFSEQYFPKPCNLEGADIDLAVMLVWEAPGTCPAGGTAVPTIGFSIYRNSSLLVTVDGNTFSYTDNAYPGFNYLPPGTYNYSITALYYHAGDTIQSLHEGPITVVVSGGTAVFLQSFVFDCSTCQPLPGATLNWGPASSITNINGQFTIIGIVGVAHDLVVSKPLYYTKVFPNVSPENFPFGICLEPMMLVGIDDPSKTAILVYPIPATDLLNVKTNSRLQNIRMFDYTGQLVYQRIITGEQTIRINVRPLRTGAYILHLITSDGQTHQRRIIVSR